MGAKLPAPVARRLSRSACRLLRVQEANILFGSHKAYFALLAGWEDYIAQEIREEVRSADDVIELRQCGFISARGK